MNMPTLSLLQTAAPLLLLGWAALIAASAGSRLGRQIADRGVMMLAAGVVALAAIGLSHADAAPAAFLVYLALALLAGLWLVQRADADAVPRQLVIPCLGFTLLYVPIGVVTFISLRAVLKVTAGLRS
jgi:predicted MFS family arabinose efflux permease